MLRSLLLLLSRQSWLRHWMETSSAAERVTSRFIAGHTLEREVAVCRHLNAEGYPGHARSSGRECDVARGSRAIARRLSRALDQIATARPASHGVGETDAARPGFFRSRVPSQCRTTGRSAPKPSARTGGNGHGIERICGSHARAGIRTARQVRQRPRRDSGLSLSKRERHRRTCAGSPFRCDCARALTRSPPMWRFRTNRTWIATMCA